MTTQSLALRSIGVPDRDSYSGLTKLCERYPTISIVVLSGQCDATLGALQLMCDSSLNIPPKILARDDASATQVDEKKPAINRSQLSTSDLGLTQRQLDVLALMTLGKTNKAICRVLNLAEPTVKNHVTAILRALKVSNRTFYPLHPYLPYMPSPPAAEIGHGAKCALCAKEDKRTFGTFHPASP